MRTLTVPSLLLLASLTASLAFAQAQYDFRQDDESLAVAGETVQQAGEQAARVLQQSRMKLTISTVGFDISAGSEAEKFLQETARIGGGGYFLASDTGQLSAALGAAAAGRTATATAPDAVVLTSPREGEAAGPNIDLTGKAAPGAVVVIITQVFNMDTGAKLRTVPGIRNRASATGDFTFRVATPRVSFGTGDKPPPLRYELHAFIARPDGTTGPETIVNLTAPSTP